MKCKGKYEEVNASVLAGDCQLNILEEIQSYADAHKSFDGSFLYMVIDFYNTNGYVSDYQYNRLVNVYYKYYMHKKI